MTEVAGYRDDPRFKNYELSVDLFFLLIGLIGN